MSTKKDTTDTSLEEFSEKKKRPESKYNASIFRECIKEGLDAKSIMANKGSGHWAIEAAKAAIGAGPTRCSQGKSLPHDRGVSGQVPVSHRRSGCWRFSA